ncbi:exported hypothetical protein [Syntrophobacter sp. SbD1]|nr:exported hypothetical protein [Syntrophobacter sp. SbD1]
MKKYLFSLVAGLLLISLAIAAGYANDVSYTYDQLNRLIGVVNSDGTIISYGYDDVGNRVIQNVTKTPEANFTASPASGAAPLSVAFTDQSVGMVSSWSWSFGDGGSSTSQSPAYTYSSAGAYTVTLTVSNSFGSSSHQTAITVNLARPVANFIASPTSGTVPLAVSFTDSSTGSVTSWSWNFGDGGTSTSQDPSHTYANPGTYTVTLTAGGLGGNSNPTTTSITVIPPPPIANFSAAPTNGTAPLAVQFTDASTGSVTGWSWNFGDGGTSTSQHPNHTYTSPGTYTVTLTATGPGGNSNPQTTSITVNPPSPVANFSAIPTNGNAPLSVQFTDSSTGSVTSWSWVFGDGGTSTSQNPIYTYSTPGTYTVSLTATGSWGSNTTTAANYVTVTSTMDRYTKLLLHGDGQNGGTTITDSSGNHNPSAVNSVVTSTTQSKFGGSSLSFTKASSSWLGFSESADWHVSSGSDFTYDFWVFPLSMPSYGLGVCGTLNSSNVGTGIALRGSVYGNNGQVAFFTNGAWQAVSNAAVPLNAWTHIAVVKHQGVVSIYINGVQSGTTYIGSCTDSGSGFSIGDIYTQGNYLCNWGFNGYIDEFRFSNGVARWTTNFTPSTSEYAGSNSGVPVANFSATPTSGSEPLAVQFTDASTGLVTSWSWVFGDGGTSTSQNPSHTYSTPGTSTVSLTATGSGGANSTTTPNYITVTSTLDTYTKLLLHGDGQNGGTAIFDSSGNHNPSVVNNVVTSTTQSKFGGSSLSFTLASTSWLGFAESTDWHISSGSDFTYDFWVFPLSMPAYGLGVCGTLNSSNGGTGIALRGSSYGDNGQVAFFTNGNWQAVSSAAVPLNAWTHIAVVKHQGVVSIYINGVQSGTTYSGSGTDSDSGFSIGDMYTQGNSNHHWNFNGYIDEFRFSNGVARWTSNFTPPTSEYVLQ